MKTSPSTRRWAQLSAYIDDQLPPRQAERLRKQLETDPALRAEYEALLRTRALLRSLPVRRAPHNYTLRPEMVRSPRRRMADFLVPALRFSSSAALLVLIFTFALPFLSGLSPQADMTQQTAPMAAEEMAFENATAEPTPMIVIWHNAPAMGGGMEAAPEGMGGGPQIGLPGNEQLPPDPEVQAMLAEPAPSDAPQFEDPPPLPEESGPEESATEMARLSEAPPAAGKMAPQPTPEPEAQAPEPTEANQTAPSEGNVILGIPPQEEQGQIQAAPPPPAAPVAAVPPPDLRLLQISLASFALIAGVISLLLARQRRF